MDWLTTNVLYEMAGGQETFNQYFEIANGQVALRKGVDTSEAGEGVRELLYMVQDSYNYIYFAGEGDADAQQAASLFKGALNRDGTFTYQGGNYVNKFADGGYLVGTQGRRGTAQPANLHDGDPVFAVIAYNTKAVFTQEGVDEKALHYADRTTQKSGLNQPIKPVNVFIHEGAENRSFARMTATRRSTEAGYDVAHGYAQVRESKIRQELKITGGFAGGAPLSKVIKD